MKVVPRELMIFPVCSVSLFVLYLLEILLDAVQMEFYQLASFRLKHLSFSKAFGALF